jgi:hypothetical protein
MAITTIGQVLHASKASIVPAHIHHAISFAELRRHDVVHSALEHSASSENVKRL